MSPVRLVLVLIVTLVVGAGVSRAHAASSGQDFQGAWVDPGVDCKVIFSRAGTGLTFKRPTDLFVNAFIITGRRLTTPNASCRIQSMKAGENGRRSLSLSCATSVAIDATSVDLALMPDGSLQRYSGASDRIGSRYSRCLP
jgi:hypothetical protein